MLESEASRARFGRWMFWALAAFCLWVTWVPPRDSLIRETGHVTLVHPHRVWVDVEITTETGAVLQCSGKSWNKRCPEEAFLRIQQSGQPVTVWHANGKPYEVSARGETIVAYEDHRKAQRIMYLIVPLLVGMGYLAGRVKRKA